MDDEKIRRKRIKRQQHKRKKREAKQQQQQLSSATPSRDAALVGPPNAGCKGAPTSPFTFSSFLKPSTRTFATLNDALPSSSNDSASIFEIHDQEAISASESPTLGSFGAEVALSRSSLVIETRLPVTYSQEEGEEGEGPFETQMSPLDSCCECLLLSVDTAQTVCMERLPVAGRRGAFSAPSSPVHSQSDFWDSDETATDGVRPLQESYNETVKRKGDMHRIRRASSVDFGHLSRNEEWALESLMMQHKLQKEETPGDVLTLGQLNTNRIKTVWRDTPSMYSDNTDDEASDTYANDLAGDITQSSTAYVPLVDSDEEDRRNEQTVQTMVENNQELTTDDLDSAQHSMLHTPSGYLRAQLQELYRSGNRFFFIAPLCGEVQNEEGQYTTIDVERLRSKPVDLGDEVGVWENTLWHIRPGLPPVGLMISSESAEEHEQREERKRWLDQQSNESTLSLALQKCKERLRKQAEQDANGTKSTLKDKIGGKRNRLAGGESTKWASIRRRDNVKAGESPKKVIAKDLSLVLPKKAMAKQLDVVP